MFLLFFFVLPHIVGVHTKGKRENSQMHARGGNQRQHFVPSEGGRRGSAPQKETPRRPGCSQKAEPLLKGQNTQRLYFYAHAGKVKFSVPLFPPLVLPRINGIGRRNGEPFQEIPEQMWGIEQEGFSSWLCVRSRTRGVGKKRPHIGTANFQTGRTPEDNFPKIVDHAFDGFRRGIWGCLGFEDGEMDDQRPVTVPVRFLLCLFMCLCLFLFLFLRLSLLFFCLGGLFCESCRVLRPRRPPHSSFPLVRHLLGPYLVLRGRQERKRLFQRTACVFSREGARGCWRRLERRWFGCIPRSDGLHTPQDQMQTVGSGEIRRFVYSRKRTRRGDEPDLYGTFSEFQPRVPPASSGHDQRVRPCLCPKGKGRGSGDGNGLTPRKVKFLVGTKGRDPKGDDEQGNEGSPSRESSRKSDSTVGGKRVGGRRTRERFLRLVPLFHALRSSVRRSSVACLALVFLSEKRWFSSLLDDRAEPEDGSIRSS
mmetsp:Transcript_5900/g.14100  ORF Transcript_5900/g.14100 Transcript_5900/m.14100 type:complete len:480 (+) Transcript_5900:710-2149(+)